MIFNSIKSLKSIIFLIFLSLSCNSPNKCEEYKNMACENVNSRTCHEAMQKYPDMSRFDCEEKIKILKSGRFQNTDTL